MLRRRPGLLGQVVLRIADVSSRVPIEVDGRSATLSACGALVSAARLGRHGA